MQISTIAIYYFLAIFVACIMLKIYEKHTTTKMCFNKKNIINILIMSVLTLLNNIFMFNIVRPMFSTILTFILFKIIFKDSIKKTIYYTLIMSISIFAIELVLTLFLPLGIKNIEVLNQSMIFKVAYSFAVNICLYFLLTNKYVIKFLKDTELLLSNNKIYYILAIIGVFICNIWVLYVGINITDKIVNLIICFTEALVIALFIITLHTKYEKELSKIKEEQLKQDLILYSKIATEYKELKHNLMNDLLIVKTKTLKTEQNFINQIINKYKSNYDWVNSVTDIPEGLQGLIFLKKNQAEIKKINFNLEYKLNKNEEKCCKINNNFKLYETLGIIFDNAIEGAALSKEKIINVVFNYENTSLIIKVMNTFNNDIDLERIGNKNYSTKNRNSGIGLNYLKKQKNKFKIKQSIKDNIFITEIMIDKNKKEKK